MKNLFSMSSRTNKIADVVPVNHPVRFVRTFVETGDERCPMAGIWSPIEDINAATDDPEIKRPAMGIFLPWRAFTLRSQDFGTLLSNTCCL